MKITIQLADQLIKQAEILAANSGKSLAAIIEDGLREKIARTDQPGRAPLLGALKGSVIESTDLLSPIDEQWTANGPGQPND